MTDERAIEILDPEHREHYESIEPVEEACRIGIKAIKRVKELEAENAELRERLDKAVELPFFQKDGEVIILIYKNKDGIVLIEKYIEDEYYNGKRGKEAAEIRLRELNEDNND